MSRGKSQHSRQSQVCKPAAAQPDNPRLNLCAAAVNSALAL
jgi:hypothetical protein